ncbi:MAG: hypothetical protein ACOCQC_01390 [Halanaerobiaceae bacterium]
MKSKLLIIVILLAAVVSVFALWKSGTYYPSYSVHNRSQNGLSIFYETLQELDYPAERTLEPAADFSGKSLQIIAGDYLEEDDLPEEWLRKGGTVVWLTPGGDQYLPDFLKEVEEQPSALQKLEEEGETFRVYRAGEGRVVSGDLEVIANFSLLEKPETGYDFLALADEFGGEKIYFNEKHFFTGRIEATFWDIIPPPLKFIFYQLLLAVAAYIFYRGKRLGRARPLVEEEERLQNEYLFAAADLYRAAGCTGLVMKSYYRSFLQEIGCRHENWLEFWRRRKLPAYETAEKLYAFMEELSVREDKGECMQMVRLIDSLRKYSERRKG